MDSKHIGVLALFAAVGAFLGLMALEITKLHGWNEVSTPVFVGTAIGHVATVIAAFVGGKYMPVPRKSNRTRLTDKLHNPPSAENFTEDTLAGEDTNDK